MEEASDRGSIPLSSIYEKGAVALTIKNRWGEASFFCKNTIFQSLFIEINGMYPKLAYFNKPI